MSSTGHLSELDLLRSQVADLSRELAERDQSGQDLREQSDLLRAIVAGTAAETGEDFFVSLVTHLTSVLHVQYAIIGEVQGDCIKKIRTLAVSVGGALVENFEYELAHTPCATALTETFACFDRDVQVTFPQFQRLADLGAESYCAVPLRTKGGAVIGLLVVMDTKPLEHSDSLQSLLGVFAPRVTAEFERRRAEEELRKSHSFLRQVIDINPNFIFAKDRDGRFTLANKAVADVYGTMVEDLIGKTDADFNPNQEEVAFSRQKDLAVMDTLQELFFSEEVITDSGGRTRWLQTVKKPILDDEGRAMMVLGSSTDITERKQMEETLRQRERALRAAIEERERISQDLHDGILQSLFAVGLAIEAGKLMLPPTARKTSGASLNQAIDQLNDVMREIRNFIAGLGSDLPEGKDLSMALQHMLALLTKNQATRVRLAVEDRAAKAVSGEQSLHLFRVIQEAVSNCIKHGHAQEAKVSLKMLKQGLRLSIRDNGCGFNPERTNGAGYGLSNMAARAQKIGGRLSVLSKPSEGTSIILDLPATGQGNEAMGT
ncbi:MAG: PAS domain-containing protein [Nitrospira sp.]